MSRDREIYALNICTDSGIDFSQHGKPTDQRSRDQLLRDDCSSRFNELSNFKIATVRFAVIIAFTNLNRLEPIFPIAFSLVHQIFVTVLRKLITYLNVCTKAVTNQHRSESYGYICEISRMLFQIFRLNDARALRNPRYGHEKYRLIYRLIVFNLCSLSWVDFLLNFLEYLSDDKLFLRTMARSCFFSKSQRQVFIVSYCRGASSNFIIIRRYNYPSDGNSRNQERNAPICCCTASELVPPAVLYCSTLQLKSQMPDTLSSNASLKQSFAQVKSFPSDIFNSFIFEICLRHLIVFNSCRVNSCKDTPFDSASATAFPIRWWLSLNGIWIEKTNVLMYDIWIH